jgi:apolipoprotein N-acyltransferase
VTTNTGAGRHPLLLIVLTALAGALVTLSLAPFNFWPAGIASCILLAHLLSNCSPGQALWRGWLFGLGLFGTGASWVYVSIHVYGHTNIPLAAFLTGLFCGGLALLHGAFAWCYAHFVRDLPGGMLLGFPALWVLFEWLRSWLFTGFPWLYLGYGHVDTWIAGWAPVVGVYGLSFICALTASCLYLAWRSRQRMSWATYAVITATLWLGGGQLKSIQWVAPASEEPLSVALYQPNIPQEKKWDRSWYRPILEKYRAAMEPLYGTDIVVWPESAIPNYYQLSHEFLDPIAVQAADSETTLITGIPFREKASGDYFNSIVALGLGDGVYHKQRLVPFGEYLPLEEQLRGLINFFDLPMSNFAAGPALQQPLRAGAYRIAPFICYEVVYPDLVARNAAGANLLITISNDSWFGRSIGPLQHLQMAQMRALENGRYMIRGTNNGISAIIDEHGKIRAQTRQFVETTLHSEVQLLLGNTPFSRLGSLPVIAGCAIALLLMVVMYWAIWREDS